jgi:hypothetical protein
MLVCAVILAADIILASKIREVLPLFQYSFLSTVGVTIWLMILTVAIEGTTLDSIDSRSLWGWLSRDVILIMMVLLLLS